MSFKDIRFKHVNIRLSLFVKVSDRAEHLGSGLLHRGLRPNTDTFFGIFAQNRPEVGTLVVGRLLVVLLVSPFSFCSQWIIGELACYTYSMVVVPLYDTLGPEALVFIIDRGNWSFSVISSIKRTREVR